MGMKKCLDTYALVEISNGNVKFVDYLDEEIIITELTLIEFYIIVYRKFNKNTAEYWLKKFERYSVSVNLDILKDAMIFREERKKQRLSFFDAVGYIFSKKNGYLFVTGDKEFENLDNVEFVKK